MTQQIINVGAVANDGTGESLRQAFNAVNNNFANIWTAGPVDSQVVISNNQITTNQTNLDLVLAGNGLGYITVKSTIAPAIDSVRDLGTPDLRFDEVHAQYYYGNGAFLTGISGGNSSSTTTFSATAPSSPNIGDVWIQSTTGVQYIYFNDNNSSQWAEMEAYLSFSSGGAGNANIDLTQVGSDIIPAYTNAYNLGNASNQWRDLWVSNSTIYMNSVPLTADGANLKYNGNVLLTTSSSLTFTNVTATGNVIAGAVYSDNYRYANGAPFPQGSNAIPGTTISLKDNVISTTVTNQNLVLWANGVGNIQTNSSLSPSIDGVYDIGSLAKRYDGIYARYFYGNGAFLTGISGGGNANTGNWAFTGNTIYNINGGVIDNSDLSHGTTASLTLPINGNSSPVAVLNYYGNFVVTTGTGPGNTTTLTYNNLGGLSVPGNVTGNYFIGNGSQLTGITATANTGNVTFSDQIVIGTGMSNLVSGLYLAPSSSSANALQYLRVRGDVSYEPTHIHFDTGNNLYFNQFIGDDNKYVLLSNTGNIVIRTDDYAGNYAQWDFGTDGNLTLPDTTALVASNGIRLEANSDSNTSGIQVYGDADANVYAHTNVVIHTDSNGTGNTWVFDANGTLTLPDNTSFQNFGSNSSEWHAGTNGYVSLASNDANTYMWVDNNGAYIATNWNAGAKQWTFDNTGNLTLPSNTFAVNYANGDPVTFGGGNATLPLANGTSNFDIATANGNVTVTTAGTNTWNFDTDGALNLANNGVIRRAGAVNIVATGFAQLQWVDSGNINIADPNATGGPTNWAWVDDQGLWVQTNVNSGNNYYEWHFGTDGNLTTSSDMNITGNITGANVVSANTFVSNAFNVVTAGNLSITSQYGLGFTGTILEDNGTLELIAKGGGAVVAGWDSTYGNGLGNIATVNFNEVGGEGIVLRTGNRAATEYNWNFDSTGNLTLPGNTFAVNYANGTPVSLGGGGYGNSNVATFLADFGSNTISTTGNIQAGDISASGNVIATGNSNVLALTTRNGDSNNSYVIPQIIMGYAGTADYPSFIHTTHNAGTPVDNTIEFWTSDGTQAGTFPANAVLGLTVTNGNIETGNISATGNITGNYIFGDGSGLTNLPAPTVTQDIASVGAMSIMLYDGNIKYNNYATVNPVSGNITGGNLLTGGVISATGNVTGNYFLGNGSQLTGVATLSFSTVSANGTSVEADSTTDTLTLTPGNNLVITGNATSDTVTFAVSDSPTFTGNVTGGNILTGGVITATGNITSSGNITGGNLLTGGVISSSGNITGNYILGNGSQLTGVVTSANIFVTVSANGTSLVADQSSDTLTLTPGNNMVITGNASTDTATFAVSDSPTFTGNVTGGNILTAGIMSSTGNGIHGNVLTAGVVSATANVTGGNILTAGLISATSSITSAANVTGGNITTAGLITATGNVTGGNILTSGLISSTGNITGGNLSVTGNVTGNTAGFAIGYRDIPQVSFTGNTTISTTDAGKHYYSTLATANTLTIANNSSQAFAIGSAINIINLGTGNITIAQGVGVTLYFAGNSTAGNRVLSSYGAGTIQKVATDTWFLVGVGIT